MTKIHDLAALGQSVWLDYIRRAFIESGELQDLIDGGVSGITSNPALFEKAIAGSADYDRVLKDLATKGRLPGEIYESLAIEDIQRAADMLRPVYSSSNGADGYASLEVNPELANNAEGTIDEARRLFAALDRPNVMIKVPATPAGVAAVETLIGEGINVNVTLMFSLEHYDAVAEAYIRGLERFAGSGGDLGRVASVASFFLSRIDSAVDLQLDNMADAPASSLKGKTAVANARLTYQRFLETFSGQRWERLVARGARPQRVLWASTSTKNPEYPDTMYVDTLIGPDTVNTIPPATLRAFQDHGAVAVTVTRGLDEARLQLAALADLGIDLNAVGDQLQVEGLAKFVRPFQALMETIAAKVARLQLEWQPFVANLGPYQGAVDEALAEIRAEEIMRRIWAHDHTVWQPDPEEVANRLGWLHSPETMLGDIGRIQTLVKSVRQGDHEGRPYTHVLLLGMGGSSLAPEVFSNAFGHDHDGLELAVLDSTDPGAVLAYAEKLDPARTLFVVSTKSGGTVETLSFFKFFYNWTAEALGQEAAGAHFIAITDGGSKLDGIAERYNFRATFRNDPDIGGRYAALTYFGLVPAALAGVDVERLLDQSLTMVRNVESCNCPVEGDNLGGRLGAIMGELAGLGRDKVTLITSPELANFGDWLEQLIAESTGKAGKGILPVVGEAVGSRDVYGNDRLFVHLRILGDRTRDQAVAALAAAGHPVVTIHLKDRYDMGGQFFLWEMATAVAGQRLGIQPFDQPNVEAAKILARDMVETYQQEGKLPEGETIPPAAGALAAFLERAKPGDYVALQAYLQPTGQTSLALHSLRLTLRDRTRLATTMGYGPRFLHSTGQLHKGDAGNGLFVQFTADAERDAPIPDEAGRPESSMSFGVLKSAQALGDARALREAGRRLIRFRLDGDVAGELQRLIEGLERL
jgi:transaldolase/glucose-6-phosphate isomerase